MQNEVTVSMNLQVALHLDGDTWVGYCPALDLASQSESEEGALAAVKEMIELWVESCLERGVLGKALEESGFSRVHHGLAVESGAQTASIKERSIPSSPDDRMAQVKIEMPAYIAAAILDSSPHAAN